MPYYQDFQKKNNRREWTDEKPNGQRRRSDGYRAEGRYGDERRDGRYRDEGPRDERYRDERPERKGYDRRNANTVAPRGNRPVNDRYGRRPAPAERSARPEARPVRPETRPAAPAERVRETPRPGFDTPYTREPENLLSGRNPIREALRADRDIEKMLVAKGDLSGSAREIVAMARERGIPVQVVERSRLDEITPHHQGIIAYASAYRYAEVSEILDAAREKGEKPFIVVLDGITDPHNLGAIIRTAACAGAHGVIVPLRRSVGLTPAAVKASAGAVETVKVARVTNLTQTLKKLKQEGLWIYAADMAGEDYRSVRLERPMALVIGSEGEGISRLVLENADFVVKLPILGAVDSLNASVAAGILMYHAAFGGHEAP